VSAAALSPEQTAFWARFRRETGETAAGPRGVDRFGDDAEMADALAALVTAGRKRATASLARWYPSAADRPQPGDLWIIENGAGAPVCVTRTTRVDVQPVHAVDAAFAFEEGEGDRTLAWWRDAHRAYWLREAAREGFVYSDDLDVVCERFELIWAPAD